MKPIYVTYTKITHNLTPFRFAVQCENMEQVLQICADLNSRSGIKNIRINKSGRGLPVESAVLFYAEYMYNK